MGFKENMKIILILMSLIIPACNNTESKLIETHIKNSKINIEKYKKGVKVNKNKFSNDFNHLKSEMSPYLLQHKDNPVNWYSWNKEAFKKAEKFDKPIFLSIGYSTCHWCHVMEHESFENEEIAEILNENFVAIKVDREERPDVDEFYMDVAQKMTGRGGWPLTIIMTPDKKPFFAGTYFPKNNFIHLLNTVIHEWKTSRAKITGITEQIMDAMNKDEQKSQFNNISENILQSAVNMFKRGYDMKYHGLQHTPKFPSPHQWKFLLKYSHKIHDKEAENIALKTLISMRKGGIYDQIGYGIHRYSTDAKWLVPHFEKMLYDQAMYIMVLTEAYGITGDNIYRDIIEEIYTYLNRVMLDSGGAFYSAEDADSDGVEGKYYVWTKKELENLLSKDEKWVIDYYNITIKGNFEGKNILNITKELTLLKDKKELLRKINLKLLKIRDKRVKPHKDTKILLHWNAMLAWALSDAGFMLNEEKYIRSSKKIIDFILKNMRNEKNELTRSYKTNINGFLTDYAYFTMALFSYYEATFDAKYLEYALFYADMMIDKFYDKNKFVTSQNTDNELPLKTDSSYDGAKPSGQSVAINILQKLSSLNPEYKKYVEISLNRIMENAKRYPIGYAQSLDTLDNFLSSYKDVVITGSLKNKDTQNFIYALRNNYYPYKTVILHPDKDNDKNIIEKLIPITKEQKSINNKATVYVCQEGMCKAPANNIKEMLKNLMK